MKRALDDDEPEDWPRRCAAGDADALKEFYLRYYAYVAAIVRNIFLRRGLRALAEDVEDGVADFFADLCVTRRERLLSFRGEGSFRAFLSVLAANHARRRGADLWRARALSGPPLEDLVDDPRSAVPPSLSGDDADEIDYLLRRLSRGEARLLRILYVDETEPALAAEVLGVSRAALYVRKHRLLRRARAILEERSSPVGASPGNGGEAERPDPP